jgi:hypothetical protein
MGVMEDFDDVSVVTSVDESPPPPRMSRRARRVVSVAVASVVATAALGGAAVGLASEKSEPTGTAPAAKSLPAGHLCHGGMRHHQQQRSSSLNY